MLLILHCLYRYRDILCQKQKSANHSCFQATLRGNSTSNTETHTGLNTQRSVSTELLRRTMCTLHSLRRMVFLFPSKQIWPDDHHEFQVWSSLLHQICYLSVINDFLLIYFKTDIWKQLCRCVMAQTVYVERGTYSTSRCWRVTEYWYTSLFHSWNCTSSCQYLYCGSKVSGKW